MYLGSLIPRHVALVAKPGQHRSIYHRWQICQVLRYVLNHYYYYMYPSPLIKAVFAPETWSSINRSGMFTGMIIYSNNIYFCIYDFYNNSKFAEFRDVTIINRRFIWYGMRSQILWNLVQIWNSIHYTMTYVSKGISRG